MVHAAASIADVNDILNDLEDQLTLSNKGVKQLTSTTVKWSNQLGLVERSYNKLMHWFYGSRLGKLSILNTQFRRLIKVSANLSNDWRELRRETKQLTVIQRGLLVPFLKMIPAIKRGSRQFQELNIKLAHSSDAMRWFRFRLLGIKVAFLTLLNVFFLAMMVLGLLSLAIEGPEGKMVELSEGIWGVHAAFVGLSSVMSGNQEDMTVWEFSAGGIVAFIIPALVLWSRKIGILTLSLYLAKFVYNEVLEFTENKTYATVAFLITMWNVALAWWKRGTIMSVLGTVFSSIYSWITVTALPAIGAWILARWVGLKLFVSTRAIPWLLLKGSALVNGVIALLTSTAFWLFAAIIAGTIMFGGWLVGKFDWVIGLIGAFILGAVIAFALGLGGIPVILIGLGLYVLGWLGKNWRRIVAVCNKHLGILKKSLRRAGNSFLIWAATLPRRLYDNISNYIQNADWAGLGMYIVNGLLLPFQVLNDVLFNIFVTAINALGEIMPEVTVPDWVPGIGGLSVDMGWDPIPLLELAKGGIVTSPTMALIGESGPEAVIPLREIRGLGADNRELAREIRNMFSERGGFGTTNHITLNIDVSGVSDRTDKRALAREISDLLNKEMRRMGGEPTRGRY